MVGFVTEKAENVKKVGNATYQYFSSILTICKELLTLS